MLPGAVPYGAELAEGVGAGALLCGAGPTGVRPAPSSAVSAPGAAPERPRPRPRAAGGVIVGGKTVTSPAEPGMPTSVWDAMTGTSAGGRVTLDVSGDNAISDVPAPDARLACAAIFPSPATLPRAASR
ncbi:hypothetical protein Mth01_45890 [Sphaerimonospora thailandensis]|uniref:Uncharacterized protein n=1 Tax=Sphaerimonospora thailandensis TaxID=795644 RepID=A0A8J3RDN1_9ACTN|nr:hypothetical protein Mth01_45890 [Sphaerimonospora thailandensis]